MSFYNVCNKKNGKKLRIIRPQEERFIQNPHPIPSVDIYPSFILSPLSSTPPFVPENVPHSLPQTPSTISHYQNRFKTSILTPHTVPYPERAEKLENSLFPSAKSLPPTKTEKIKMENAFPPNPNTINHENLEQTIAQTEVIFQINH